MSSSIPAERFRSLFEAESPAVLAYALRRTARTADAADVVAESFLIAWRRIDDVPDGREGRLWLYGVARRVLANQRRGDLRRDRLADQLRSHLSAEVADPWEDRRADVALVRAALAHLDDADRELLLLVHWEGLSPAEVADLLGLHGATTRTRLHRARGRLADQVRAMGWDGERSGRDGHVRTEGQPPLLAPEEAS